MSEIFDKNGFAIKSGLYLFYSFIPDTGEFAGEIESPLGAGQSMPSNCTLTAPPVSKENFVYCWKGNAWEAVENHRGETVFNEKTGVPFEIKQLGALPDGYTEIVPPQLKAGETLGGFDETEKKWIVIPPTVEQQALFKYQHGMQTCAEMAPQGKTPSEKMQAYYKQLWEIANPPASQNARVVLAAVTADAPTKLPAPPFDPNTMSDPDSGWWV